jgi:hypothetical protein
VFYYKNKAYWFAGFGGDFSYLYLYVFSYDGGGAPSLVRRKCDEMGTFLFRDTNGNVAAQNMYTSQPPVGGVTRRVEPYRDRLLLVPNGAPGMNASHTYISEYLGQFYINPDNTVSMSPLYQPTPNSSASYAIGESTPDMLFTGMLAACHWRGVAYSITSMGKAYKIDPSTGVRTEVFDLTSDNTLLIPGGPWTTEFQGDTGSNLVFNGSNSTMHFHPHGRGGRVYIQNLNGVAGNAVTAFIFNTGSSSLKVIDANGNTLPGQPAGVTFTAKWGLLGSTASGPSQNRYVHMFVYNDLLHVLALSSQSGATTTATSIPPWTLHVWDGTTLTSTVLLPLTGAALGISVTIDEESGLLHIVHNDHIAGNIKHKTVDLNSRTLSDNGVVCSYTTNSQNFGTDRFGMVTDKVQAYDPYDVTGGITDATVDRFEGTVTLSYWLYGLASDVASVGFQYNTGAGWKNATRRQGEGNGLTALNSSPTGWSYQFVHDAAADLGGGFLGSLAYRLQVTSQTRNT